MMSQQNPWLGVTFFKFSQSWWWWSFMLMRPTPHPFSNPGRGGGGGGGGCMEVGGEGDYMSLCQKVLGEDHPIHFLVLNASSGLSFLWTNLTLSERVCIKEIIKINLTPSQFWVSKIWKFTPSPGRKSAKEGWTFRVHRFSCRFVCIFLL